MKLSVNTLNIVKYFELSTALGQWFVVIDLDRIFKYAAQYYYFQSILRDAIYFVDFNKFHKTDRGKKGMQFHFKCFQDQSGALIFLILRVSLSWIPREIWVKLSRVIIICA